MAPTDIARRGSGLIAATAFALAPVAFAQATPKEDAVTRAEDARLRAEVSHDVVQLRRLVAADLWYVHANGRTQDRAAYLAAAETGDSPVYDARLSDRSVTVDGRIAVTHGTADYLVRIDTRPRRARYVAVYRRTGAGWALVSWQNTAVPEPK